MCIIQMLKAYAVVSCSFVGVVSRFVARTSIDDIAKKKKPCWMHKFIQIYAGLKPVLLNEVHLCLFLCQHLLYPPGHPIV